MKKREFGPALEAELAKAEVDAGHVIMVARPSENAHTKKTDATLSEIYPIGVYFGMEEPGVDGKSRLTLDVTNRNYQRGELWLAYTPAGKDVNGNRFKQQLRVHNIRVNPFKLDASGRITSNGSLTMYTPVYWECKSCGHQERKIPAARIKQVKRKEAPAPECRICPNSPKLVFRAEQLKVPVPEHPVAEAMHGMFTRSSTDTAESQGIIPRIWASYRVCDAPPDEAWVIDPKDNIAMELETRSLNKFATKASVAGMVVAIDPRGPEAGAGFHVWVGPEASAGLDFVTAGMDGRVFDVGVEEETGLRTVYVLPDGVRNGSIEACDQLEVYPDNPAEICVKAGDRIAKDTAIAVPVGWHRHTTDARASLVVSEGDMVEAGDRLSAGYTIRPVGIAIKLRTPGVQAVLMEATYDKEFKSIYRLGWLSRHSLLGGLRDQYGYTIKLAYSPKTDTDARRRPGKPAQV